ncbi:MAG: hypothetical protein Q8Q09_18490 [Deltaproteobacteria bacterium]|nr:hypothetical protein [Deltaproteobacteria bacterium]
MNTLSTTVALFALSVVPQVAFAQAAPQPVPPPPGATLQVTANAPPPPCSPAADALYTEAMRQMSTGSDASAATLFGRVLEMCPTHPTAAEMQRNAAMHAQPATPAVTGTTTQTEPLVVQGGSAGVLGSPNYVVSDQGGLPVTLAIPQYNLVYGPDPVTGGARAQLVVGQLFAGMALGGLIPAMANVGRAEVIAGGLLLGGAVGVAGSLLASMNGVTAGQALVVNLGSTTGFGVGAGIAALAGGVSGGISSGALFGLMGAGIALGTAGGAVAAMYRPLSGKVAMVSTGIGWGAMVGTHIFIATLNTSSAVTSAPLGGLLLGGMAVGGVTTTLLAGRTDISADRMGWINLSMAGGWLVFGLSSALFGSSLPAGGLVTAYSVGSILGAVAGGVFGVLITRRVDDFWVAAHDAQQNSVTVQRSARLHRTPSPINVNFVPGGPNGAPVGASLMGTF